MCLMALKKWVSLFACQSGKYHQPSFMSQESLKLIKSMLQVDPKKRITVQQLQSHPWISLGVLDSIEVKPEDFKYYDTQCVRTIASYYQVEPDMMWKIIQKWKYDYLTATYFLLMTRKKRKLPLKLSSTANRVNIFDGSCPVSCSLSILIGNFLNLKYFYFLKTIFFLASKLLEDRLEKVEREIW